jgi:hypothetical protein
MAMLVIYIFGLHLAKDDKIIKLSNIMLTLSNSTELSYASINVRRSRIAGELRQHSVIIKVTTLLIWF